MTLLGVVGILILFVGFSACVFGFIHAYRQRNNYLYEGYFSAIRFFCGFMAVGFLVLGVFLLIEIGIIDIEHIIEVLNKPI